MRPNQILPLASLVGLCVSLALGCSTGEDQTDFDEAAWLTSVRRDVSFPLPEAITVTVGYIPTNSASASQAAPARNISQEWLEQRTNIHFELIPMGTGRLWRMATLPEMIENGTLPDLVAERIVDPKDQSIRELFVNVLDFSDLTPWFNSLLRSDDLFLKGTLARLEGDDELYSLGQYSPANTPFQGALAYRQDVFEHHGLRHRTWDELESALRMLKRTFADSYPFGVTPSLMFGLLPSWFGSGFDQRYACYYDYAERRWVFGPLEEEFERFVQFLTALYQEGLFHPHSLNPPPGGDFPIGNFVRDNVFVAPLRAATGPAFENRFSWAGREYGALTASGDWDGTGIWVSAMPLPKNASGRCGFMSANPWSNVSSGFAVNKDSPYVGELLACLDLLYQPEVALVLALGPESTVWEYRDEEPRMKAFIRAPYNPDGTMTSAEYLAEQSLSVGFPVVGFHYDTSRVLGSDLSAYHQYYLKYAIGIYYDSGRIITDPRPRFVTEDDPVLRRIGMLSGKLATVAQGEVLKFILGRRSLNEYAQFREELREIGADALVDLLEESTELPLKRALPIFQE